MSDKMIDKIEEIIHLMKDIDRVLCPSCNKFETCKSSNDLECLQSTAVKARKMRE